MRYKWLRLGGAALAALFIAGCAEDGKDGAPADPAVLNSLQSQIDALVQGANAETCVVCHTGDPSVARTGPMHQALYKEFYQDGVVTVQNMNFSTNGTNTATLQFTLVRSAAHENGAGFVDCSQPTNTNVFAIGAYWSEYDPANPAGAFPSNQSLTGTKGFNSGTGLCTFTQTGLSQAVVDKMALPGVVRIYGMDKIVEREGQIRYGKYPFAGAVKIGAVNYVSNANVKGCENCHTQPFLKHAYIYGQVDDGTGTKGLDFYTCKGCHVDTTNGTHRDWQLLKDDPAKYAELTEAAAACAAAGTTNCDSLNEQVGIVFGTKYDYKRSLMNDVHMSHNMEFAYPQKLTNCVTCHEGKLTAVLETSTNSTNKFKAETCISCHALNDPDNETSGAARGPGLVTMMAGAPAGIHNAFLDAPNYTLLRSTNCVLCHTGSPGRTFSTMHNGGYDPVIYASDGTKYSDTYKVNIDSASKTGNTLTIGFSATESPDLADYAATDIKPMVLIGLYGYDTKDFIVAAHGSDASGNRLLEWVFGTTNPRFSGTQTGATWSVTVDLTMWADKIADGTIKRAEIAVLPEIGHKTLTTVDRRGNTVPVALGLDAPSRTFDLVANAFDDTFMTYNGQFASDNLVKVKKTTGTDGTTGCNTCHDQLATTFHSGTRGGNIRVCRICHEVSNAGSHLELQSRSIDSYVHAVHSFQAFDPGDIDFSDPVEALKYEHHIGTTFPRFGILNCESCHSTGRYNVPSQGRSMPGVLSGTDTVAGRNIGAIPPSVTGPAVRACGGCHRAQKINADDPAELAVLTQHFKTFGYVVDAPTDSTARRTLWESIVDKIMSVFK